MTDRSIGTAAEVQESQAGSLPGLLGFEWLRLERETVE
jgi:hypothetical protein